MVNLSWITEWPPMLLDYLSRWNFPDSNSFRRGWQNLQPEKLLPVPPMGKLTLDLLIFISFLVPSKHIVPIHALTLNYVCISSEICSPSSVLCFLGCQLRRVLSFCEFMRMAFLQLGLMWQINDCSLFSSESFSSGSPHYSCKAQVANPITRYLPNCCCYVSYYVFELWLRGLLLSITTSKYFCFRKLNCCG